MNAITRQPAVQTTSMRLASPAQEAVAAELAKRGQLYALADVRPALPTRVRVALPIADAPPVATAPAAAPAVATSTPSVKAPVVSAPSSADNLAALQDMRALLATPGFVAKDATAAKTVTNAIKSLAAQYNGRTANALNAAVAHWLAAARQVLAEGTFGPVVATAPAATPTAPQAVPAAPAATPAAAPGATQPAPGSGLAASAIPYDDLPARMKGGKSAANGMPVIILRDVSEIAMLPMWNGMHPMAADSYRTRLTDALGTEGGSIMGFAGYEIEVVGTSGVERANTPATPIKPWVSDADIKAFVAANLGSPAKIAAAMTEYGVSFNRIQSATGYTRAQIVDYVMASGCAALVALL